MGSQKSKPETLKQKLEANPTALGDPVSLKAETADSHPTEHDTGAAATGKPHTSLKEAAMKNPTLLGDPVSLKAEKSESEPTEHDRGAQGAAGKSKL